MARRNKGKLFSSHGKATGSVLLRRILFSLAGILILLIILGIAGYYQLMAYLQGDDFRQKAEQTASHSLQAEQVDLLSNFTINGNRVALDGAQLSRFRNIEQAQFGRINAEINRTALLSRQLHLQKLSLEEASLVIVNKPASSKTKSGRKSPTVRKTGTRQSSTPDSERLKLDLLECKDTDIHFTNNGRTYQLLGASVSATPAPRINKNAWQLNAENARFHTPFSWLRACSIKSATAIYNGKSINLSDCSIMLTPGEMRTKAHYDLKTTRWTADLQVNKGDIRRILNDDWKKRLTGEMYGRMMLTGERGNIRTASGNLSVLNGVLEGLPFLSQLPLGNTHPYRTIELEKADCQILYPYENDQVPNAWLFHKITLSSKDGSLIIHGQILVGKGGQLGGRLTIGIPDRIFNALPLPADTLTEQLFNAEGEEPGYKWVNMNLSGTIDKPQEDLSIRIATLASRSLGKAITEIPANTAAGLLNTLLSTQTKQSEDTQEETDTYDEDETEDSDDAPAAKPFSPLDEAADAAGSLLRSIF